LISSFDLELGLGASTSVLFTNHFRGKLWVGVGIWLGQYFRTGMLMTQERV